MSKSALLVIDLQNEYLPTGKLPLVKSNCEGPSTGYSSDSCPTYC